MGNTAGIVAGQIYRKAPCKLGNSFSLGALCVSEVAIVGKIFYVKHLNAMKAKMEAGVVEDTRKVRDGDRALDFKYHISGDVDGRTERFLNFIVEYGLFFQ